MGDLAGFLVLIGSFFVVNQIKIKSVQKTAFWCLILYHFIVIIDCFFFEFLNKVDACGFFEVAKFKAQSGNFDFSFDGTSLFTSFIGLFFYIFGPSQFLGTEIASFALACSFIPLMKFCTLLKCESHAKKILQVYTLMPHALGLFTNMLRESSQILFFMWAAFYLISFIQSHRGVYLIKIFSPLLVLFFLHNGMPIFILFFVIYTLIACIQNKKIGLSLIFIFLIGFIIEAGSETILQKLFEEKTEFADTYKEHSEDTRATYKQAGQNVFNNILYYGYYLAKPFPWEISSPLDIFGSFESLMRCYLLLMAIKRLIKYREKEVFHLLILFGALSFLWSLGTSNYGTSIRHNATHFWIVVLLGIPVLGRPKRMEKIKK